MAYHMYAPHIYFSYLYNTEEGKGFCRNMSKIEIYIEMCRLYFENLTLSFIVILVNIS